MSKSVEPLAERPDAAGAGNEDLQMLAISLLLCVPSDLQKVWLANDDEDAWGRALDDLQHVLDRERALEHMRQLSQRRPFFEGIGLLFESTDEYTGDPPHPPQPAARALLERLK